MKVTIDWDHRARPDEVLTESPLTPSLSSLGRGRALDCFAQADPLGQADHHPLLPTLSLWERVHRMWG
jgi:hypothetical protein